MRFDEMNREELEKQYASLKTEYERKKALGLSLDMSRGNPSRAQLSMGSDILNACTDVDDLFTEDGIDCRNYGSPGGIKEMREIFGGMTGVPASNVYIGGVSSLQLMFDTINVAMFKGLAGSGKPWGRCDRVKFICPVPGYDRHLTMLEYYGIEMVTVPLTGCGPDMDKVEELASSDPDIKGMWIVPIYSNPTGDIYSAETLERLASMKTAAEDFTIFCDNAYSLHSLYGEYPDPCPLYRMCADAGNPDRTVFFASFSKITFAGGSVSCVAGGDRTMELLKKAFSVQIITNDKINQLRHVRVFKDREGVMRRMDVHADIIRPKFELVEKILKDELGDSGAARWNHPRGGYFIGLWLMKGCARETVRLCAEAGVKLTGAGAGFPYGKDPDDSFIRIAPTFPSLADLEQAASLLCVSAKLACCEKLLGTEKV